MTGAVIGLWVLAGVVLASAAAVGAVRYLRHRYVVVTVEGTSMTPTYRPGDQVLVRRPGRRGPTASVGAVVVVRRPDVTHGWRSARPVTGTPSGERWFIKRVAAAPDGPAPEGHLFLLGDHPDSLDSRRYWPCPEHQVLGTVVRTLPALA